MRRLAASYGASAVLFFVVLFLWTGFVRLFNIPQYLLPTPGEVVGSFGEDWADLWKHTRLTL
ncbi:MAG: hypothetical protein V3V56_00185, partial [bacterium]